MSLDNTDPEPVIVTTPLPEAAPVPETASVPDVVQTPEVKEPRRKYAAPSPPRVLNCMQPTEPPKT
jgi:hypothetical protein